MTADSSDDPAAAARQARQATAGSPD